MATSLSGKTLLVTGASRGIGKALMKDLFLDG
jgi:NAD(P)-dependent dehydrogenase (short-subunit alcohol dehydrogenase family)